MATAARTLKTVSPHIPLIKFPSRAKVPQFTRTSLGGGGQTAVTSSTPRGSGIDYMDLPPRFRRRPVSQEEIEFIEKGGPV